MSGGGILNADMATVRGWAVAGLRWWLDELAGLVPRPWREARLGRVMPVAYDPVAGTLAAAGGVLPRRDAAIAVVLPAALTLTRRIDLPAVNPRDLASLIELDRDRIMPQGRDALLAARVLARDAATGRMQVAVAGLPLARAEALASVLRAAPRLPVQVLAGSTDQPGGAPIDLLPAMRRAGLVGGTGRSAAPWWLAVGFLFLLNIGLLVWRDSAALDSLSDAVDQQQPAVGVAHRIIGRMRADDRLAQATAAARQTREPVMLIARIARALPPGTWLQRFEWHDNTILLAGYHPPHTDVPGTLRRAGLAVIHYGDTTQEAATPLGTPFEVTVRLGAG